MTVDEAIAKLEVHEYSPGTWVTVEYTDDDSC